jgi:hypothetical protein
MSYSSVYAINKQGDVVYVGAARNNHAYAPHAWDVIAKKTGFGDFPWNDKAKLAKFWPLFNSGKLSERDNLVLGSTYDRVWVARENLGALAAALRSFYEEHSWIEMDPSKPWRTERTQVAETMLGVAKLLDEVAKDETHRGACFNLCSANENPWVVRYGEMNKTEQAAFLAATGLVEQPPSEEGEADELQYEHRPYNFDQDVGKKRIYGGEPFELFDVEGYKRSEEG